MLAATVLVGTALIASPAAASPSGADSAPGGVPGTTWAALDDAIGMVSSAAGVGVIAAAVTSWTGVGGLAAGTIAGTFAVSAGLIQTCSANGRGMAAHMIPPTAVMWCNNQ